MRQQGYRFSLDTLPDPEDVANPVGKPAALLQQSNGSRLT
jgi:hypothetical protein